MMKKCCSPSPSWLKTKRLNNPDSSTTLITTAIEGLFLPAVDFWGVFCKRIAYPELRIILAVAVNLYFEQCVPEWSS